MARKGLEDRFRDWGVGHALSVGWRAKDVKSCHCRGVGVSQWLCRIFQPKPNRFGSALAGLLWHCGRQRRFGVV